MIFEITPPLWQIAREEAEVRHTRGDNVRTASQARGGRELEMLIDMSGVVGELIAAEVFSKIFNSVDSSSLRDHQNFKRPDIVVDEIVSVDVKTIPEGANRKYLVVNRRAHNDPKKRSDFYLPIKIISDKKALIYDPVSHYLVSSWPSNPNICRYEPGHCMELTNLKDASLASIKKIIGSKKLLLDLT